MEEDTARQAVSIHLEKAQHSKMLVLRNTQYVG